MSPLDMPAPALSADLFSLWNAKLLETFFSSASEGDEVWLQLDGHELDLIAPELGGEEGFLMAVRAGPAWETFERQGKWSRGQSSDLVLRVEGLVRQRLYPACKPRGYVDPGLINPTYHGCKAPTYLPFLAALVRSSALAKESYYKHLRNALLLPDHWNSPQLERLEMAWDDLQDWTRQTKGRFGRFVLRRLGAHAHLGIPRSQCIMSRQDCEASSRVFALARLRPGQQWTPAVAADVVELASDELSASFRDALQYPELRGPVQASLRSLFEEWDGTAPGRSCHDTGKEGQAAVGYGQVELALSLHGDLPRWQVHWRVPPSREGNDLVLERNGASWRAPAWGNEPCSTSEDAGTPLPDGSLRALLESATHDVYFDARLEEEGSAPVPLGQYVLQRSELRVLVWGVDYASQREELQEHPLPRHGHAYLLASQRVAPALQAWLGRGNVKHEIIEIEGLPAGWMLACLADCNALTDAAVNALPGTVMPPALDRILALVGGRSVSRSSKRQYLSYDLPSIELDAPHGTTLQVDAGLFLEEVRSTAHGSMPGVRRFRIWLRDPARKSFRIAAVAGTRELATTTLRIAADSGEQVSLGRNFSLDPRGSPQGTLAGLRGTLRGEATAGLASQGTPLSTILASLGDVLDPQAIARLASNPAALFLDSLARDGTMAYGTAKDQLARLLAKSRATLRPDLVLLDLRRRGHIEIETSTRGHFTRIHAVQPGLYRLPLSACERPVYAVLGTLAMQQWHSLFDHARPATIHELAPDGGLLPTWRILASDGPDLDQVAQASGMECLPVQSMLVAAWAASCDDVRSQVEDGSVESIGALNNHPHRLHAGTGCFVEARSLEPRTTCDLFRMDDRDIIGGRVYVLAIRKENVARYGFVRDSRWGVWIALLAFARFVKEEWSIDDACPWPIPYSAKDGTVLLPARISLPVVLERALVLCSGRSPEVVQAFARGADGQCAIARESDGKGLAVVSQVYGEMASGRWLLYRAVPREVAATVADKLGAILATA